MNYQLAKKRNPKVLIQSLHKLLVSGTVFPTFSLQKKGVL